MLPVVWGTTFPIVKYALVETTPLLYNFFRFGITAAGFLILSSSARRGCRTMLLPRSPEARAVRLDGVVLGATVGAGYILQVYGLQTTSASKCAFLTSTTIIWTPILAYLTGRERLGWIMISAILVTILGVLLLTHPYHEMKGFETGDLLTLACAGVFSIYIIWVDRATPHAMKLVGSRSKATAMVASNQLLVATTIMALMLPFGENSFRATPFTLGSLAYLALFATAMTAYLQAMYQEAVSPSAAAVIYMLEPVVAALIGFALLHERMKLEELGGAALIVLGVLVAQIPTLRARRRNS